MEEILPATGDGTSATLWLSKITHTGSDTTAGGSAVTLPSVSFTATMLQNRVATHDGLPILTRNSIGSITTETGEVIGVNYKQVNPCSWPVSAHPLNEYFVVLSRVSGPLSATTTPILDWFNKWEVASVTEADPTGGNPDQAHLIRLPRRRRLALRRRRGRQSQIPHLRAVAWLREVQTFTGQGNDAQTESETTYYRGMSQNNDTTKVTLTDSQGGTHDDIDQLAGSNPGNHRLRLHRRPDRQFDDHLLLGVTRHRVTPRTGLPALTANASGAGGDMDPPGDHPRRHDDVAEHGDRHQLRHRRLLPHLRAAADRLRAR